MGSCISRVMDAMHTIKPTSRPPLNRPGYQCLTVVVSGIVRLGSGAGPAMVRAGSGMGPASGPGWSGMGSAMVRAGSRMGSGFGPFKSPSNLTSPSARRRSKSPNEVRGRRIAPVNRFADLPSVV